MTAPKRPRVVWLVVRGEEPWGQWFHTRALAKLEAANMTEVNLGCPYRVVRAEVKP